MNASPRWRTILVESQTLFREVLAKAIRSDDRFELVAEADDGLDGKTACEQLQPHLVLMDICLSQMDGIELASLLIKNSRAMRVLVISDAKDPFTLNRLAQAGIHGYVAKDQPWEILEEAMVEVASGRRYFTAEMCQNQERLKSDPDGFANLLSIREQEILCYVASGWTSRSIATRLSLSHRSIETFRYRIMRKLGIGNVAGLIDYAYRNGFVKSPTSGEASSESRVNVWESITNHNLATMNS